jgi:hypothetical protein
MLFKKLLIIGTGGIITNLLYRKITEFKTNIVVIDKVYFRRNYFVKTTKSEHFVLGDGIKDIFKSKLFLYDKFEIGQMYHVKGYGLNFPKIGIYKHVTETFGTPCKLNHCKEKSSFLSKFL